MATTKASQKAVNKYMKANYDRVNLTVPKGAKDTIKDHANSMGESVNGFINRAINETMERDKEEAIELPSRAEYWQAVKRTLDKNKAEREERKRKKEEKEGPK